MPLGNLIAIHAGGGGQVGPGVAAITNGGVIRPA